MLRVDAGRCTVDIGHGDPEVEGIATGYLDPIHPSKPGEKVLVITGNKMGETGTFNRRLGQGRDGSRCQYFVKLDNGDNVPMLCNNLCKFWN